MFSNLFGGIFGQQYSDGDPGISVSALRGSLTATWNRACGSLYI